MTKSVKPLLSRITSSKCANSSRPTSDLQTHKVHFYIHQQLTRQSLMKYASKNNEQQQS